MPRACVAGLVRPWRVPVVRSAMMPRSERPVPPQRHLRGRYVRTFVVQLVPLRLQPTQVRCFIPHRELELLDLRAVIPAKAILRGWCGHGGHRERETGRKKKLEKQKRKTSAHEPYTRVILLIPKFPNGQRIRAALSGVFRVCHTHPPRAPPHAQTPTTSVSHVTSHPSRSTPCFRHGPAKPGDGSPGSAVEGGCNHRVLQL